MKYICFRRVTDSDFGAFTFNLFADPESRLIRIFGFPFVLRGVLMSMNPTEVSSVHVAWVGKLKMWLIANEQQYLFQAYC